MLQRLLMLQQQQPLFHALRRKCHSTLPTESLFEISDSLPGWKEKLRNSGVGDVDFNLKCLVECVMDKKLGKTYGEEKLTKRQLQQFERLCEARCKRQPLQHLVGKWDFRNLTLKTHPDVFIPRPETEEFVDKVIEKLAPSGQFEMLEVGCGSGAMSLAILKALPQAESIGFDMCAASTKLAQENAELLELQERFKVYTHTMTEDEYVPKEIKNQQFDVIISNPPYVTDEDFALLEPEVTRYENINALDGGRDGLQVVRFVLSLSCNYLKPHAKLFLELGNNQPPLVQTIVNLQYTGALKFIDTYEDKLKRERFVEIEKL